MSGKIHQRIRQWYNKHGRKDLPWRKTGNPYHIYVSEIMLQQTQVGTVLTRYYHPFLKKFPTLAALAKAPEVEVMKAWEGLGYYQRARNMHKAAKMAGAYLPDTPEGLMALPGIGKNTAHAILALAYHQPVAVLEANVKRVLARYYAVAQASWEQAEQLLDRKHPFIYNQAMMDIGAIICSPRTPKCNQCPLAPGCTGKSNPLIFPSSKETKPVPIRHRKILAAVNKAGHIALVRKEEGRLLAGLYVFPQTEAVIAGKSLGKVVQHYSHFTLKADVVLQKTKVKDGCWYSRQQIAELPLSGLDRKVLKILIDHLPANRQNQRRKS